MITVTEIQPTETYIVDFQAPDIRTNRSDNPIESIQHLPLESRASAALLMTQPIIHSLQARLDGPLVTYWNNSRGSITDDDADALRFLVHDLPRSQTLYLCLTSCGGNGEASLRLADVIRQHCERLVVLVPRYARSAATMWALAADEIRMSPSACLSPVDTSISHPLAPATPNRRFCDVGQDELNRIVQLWRDNNAKDGTNPYKSLYQYIHPLVIGAVDRAMTLSMRICETLLAHHEHREGVRRKIAKTLITGYPSHGFPIMLNEAQRIGLKAKPTDNSELDRTMMDLISLYSAYGEFQRMDTDVNNHRDNEVKVIIEREGRVVHFREQSDWTWTSDGREWTPINQKAGWFLNDVGGSEIPLGIR